jgi:3-oxoacyl-[acyl-carrier protein] reductase
MKMGLEEKIVHITGAASGIGKATAKLFKEEGANVVISDYDKKNLELTAEELEIKYVYGDVREKNDVKKMINFTAETYKRIDILVNNAGLSRIGPFEKMSEEDWDICVDTNGKGTFFCSQEVLEIMMKQNSGCIINLASINSLQGVAQRGLFSYAKGGIVTLTKTLAAEFGKYNIRVNAVAPGHTLTKEYKSKIAEGIIDINNIKKLVPLKELLEPKDIANTIVFLASDNAKFISGTIIPIDGGWLADGGKGM